MRQVFENRKDSVPVLPPALHPARYTPPPPAQFSEPVVQRTTANLAVLPLWEEPPISRFNLLITHHVIGGAQDDGG
jgi:hypothetical protein